VKAEKQECNMGKLIKSLGLAAAALLAITAGVTAQQQLSVDINRISSSGIGDKIGTIDIAESKSGVSFAVAVKGLPPGKRGFHVHEKGDCGPAMKDGQKQAGMAAGEHYDPEHKKSHKGPKGKGHKGDLPALESKQGVIDQTVTSSRLKLADIRGRSLVIHEGGDNYSDQPDNGGGKGRIACATIPKQ
jgi:superoxide dismutase, Cu-Zn family